MSGDCITDVVNHPQSLWISLWTSFRHLAQVTYHKGFFFDRSNFERSEFKLLYQRLRVFFTVSRVPHGVLRPHSEKLHLTRGKIL